MNLGTASVIRANSRHLPLADNSVDLVVTSPPYFALRSYQDGCSTCATSDRATMRGYMERYCPECQRVFESGRNKCHVCNVTTLTTDATKAAQKARATARHDCPECKGTGKGHYAGQIGDEPTPAAFVASLLEVTRECVRVLKPSGSLWVNLGDKYATAAGPRSTAADIAAGQHLGDGAKRGGRRSFRGHGVREKSLYGIPWRYALACIDDLGLILRAEVIWSKPNGLPESVTDRVRRSHETWFHFVLNPRYYSAVDEIREPHKPGQSPAALSFAREGRGTAPGQSVAPHRVGREDQGLNPLGKLPGSVWTEGREFDGSLVRSVLEATAAGALTVDEGERILWAQRETASLSTSTETPTSSRRATAERDDAAALATSRDSVWVVPTEPLRVPEYLGIDHFAAFPTEFPRRIIQGWSPAGVCVECGEGRRPVTLPTGATVLGRDLVITEQAECGRLFSAWMDANGLRFSDLAPIFPSANGRLTGAVSNWRNGKSVMLPEQAETIEASYGALPDRLTALVRRVGPIPTPPDKARRRDGRVVPGNTPNAVTGAAGRTLTGYVCACPEPTADTTPAIVLDPFGGTGTTALVAKALGRHGISVDMSADYCRLAEWRVNDLDQLAKIQGIKRSDAAREADGLDMDSLFDLLDGDVA